MPDQQNKRQSAIFSDVEPKYPARDGRGGMKCCGGGASKNLARWVGGWHRAKKHGARERT